MVTDPGEMFSILIGIPGARAVEMDDDDDDEGVDLRVVIETREQPSLCPSCGTMGTEVGRVVQDLGISSAGLNAIRTLWSRREFSCSDGCSAAPWLEQSGDVEAFVVRIAQARPIRFS
ncbi:MAG: hypothetical protein ACR2NJ_09640 [Acidimicrobiales bacterium]